MMDTTKEMALSVLASSGVSPGQRYRHYKSGNEYEIVTVGVFEASLEPMIAYRRVANADSGDPTVWMRYLSIFKGHVARNGQLIPRFQRIES